MPSTKRAAHSVLAELKRDLATQPKRPRSSSLLTAPVRKELIRRMREVRRDVATRSAPPPLPLAFARRHSSPTLTSRPRAPASRRATSLGRARMSQIGARCSHSWWAMPQPTWTATSPRRCRLPRRTPILAGATAAATVAAASLVAGVSHSFAATHR